MTQYKYSSDEPAGIFQLDSILRQMGERSRQSGAKWECDVTKNDDGSIVMSMNIMPAPPPPDLGGTKPTKSPG